MSEACAYYPRGLALALPFDLFRKRKHDIIRSSEIKPSPLSCLHLTLRREGEEETLRERENVFEKNTDGGSNELKFQ